MKDIQQKHLNKVCLIIPYFGKWPDYFEIFLHSAQKQDLLDIILFSDIEYRNKLPSNIKIIKFSLKDFNTLASSKLNLKIEINNPYKLCDFKPLYGHIFEDYLNNYDFWAFGDLDVIYGKLFKLLPQKWYLYDILTFREEWISGSLTILKNNSYINKLYKKSKLYKQHLLSLENCAFDECGHIYHLLQGKKTKAILKYDKIESFTWIIRNEELNHNLKIFSKKIIKESIPKNDYIFFNNGSIIDSSNKEYIYYHYITEKRTYNFVFPKWGGWQKLPDKFYIDNTGFYTFKEYKTKKYFILKNIRKIKGNIKSSISLLKRIFKKLGVLKN